MIAKLIPIKGTRPAAKAVASLLILFVAAVNFTAAAAFAAEEELCFIGLNDNLLENSECTLRETVTGDIYADAVRAAAQTDFAVVPAGVFSEKRIEHGKTTMSDVENSLTADGHLAVAEVTGARLKAIIEKGASSFVLDPETEAIIREESASADFLQVSGFSVVLDVSAPVGDRVMYITTPDGAELDLTDDEITYTLASTHALLENFGACSELEISLSAAVAQYLPTLEGLTEYEAGRISIVGSTDDKLIDKIPLWTVIFAAVFFCFAGLLVLRAKENT